MTGSCPLCERSAAADEVYSTHLDATPRDERLDYVALKRDLEEVLECRLTVAGIKRHFHDHIVYVLDPDPDDPGNDDTADDQLRGAPRDRHSQGARRWRR